MGRKGPHKVHRAGAVTVTIGSARARLRRWLVVPAALAGVFSVTLLGAAPAQAGGYKCNLRYYFNYDGSPASGLRRVP
jgi:hypothetical protein